MASTAPRILVVDDNEQNRALAQAALEDEGLDVILAQSGAEAIALVEAKQPDCVLLDVRMPGMDGFAACAAIRALPGGEELPIVFLTAQRDLETFDRATEAGADDFLTKPVRPAELVMRVRAALKLRRVSEELGDHYELVRRQRDDLMRLQLQKERLSAFVVHDLKNPIHTLDLHAQLLLRNKELPDRARDSAQCIRSEARALLRMVLNLLDIARSEEGTLVPSCSRVELQPLIGGVLEEFAVKAKNASVSVVDSVQAVSTQADADLLRRVVENLLDNAIRHAPDGTAIEVVGRAADSGVEIVIADAGPGVPYDMRERIFDRYVQVGSERLVSRAGRGLGLSFCRLAVEAHGGRIWIEDRAPGAAFHVSLPA